MKIIDVEIYISQFIDFFEKNLHVNFIKEPRYGFSNYAYPNIILKEGSKNYKPDIVKVWNQIWSGYKADPNGFTTRTVNSGQIYNVNNLCKVGLLNILEVD